MENSKKNTVRKIIDISHVHRRVMENEFKNTGVFPTQHHVLMYLGRNSNASQTAIATEFQSSPATVAVTLKKLEAGGYIEREIDKEDNRYNKITITNKGKDIIEYSKKVFDYVDNQMFDGFSEDEINSLYVQLERIINNLNNYINKSQNN